MKRSSRRALAIFIFAALLTLAIALSSCVAPAFIRKGPAKVSSTPIDTAGSRANQLANQNVDLSRQTTLALAKAIEIANKPVLESGDLIKLRLELAGAKTQNDALTKSLLETKGAVAEWQRLAGEYKAARDLSDQKYTDAAKGEVSRLEGVVWRERIFGWPIACGIGMVLGAIGTVLLGFAKRAALAAMIPHL